LLVIPPLTLFFGFMSRTETLVFFVCAFFAMMFTLPSLDATGNGEDGPRVSQRNLS